MKQKRYLWAMLAVLGLGITGCQPEPLAEDKVIVPENEGWASTMSLNEFKVTYDVKDSLFSVNNIESNVVIRGRVISTDVAGNIYKYFVMQDASGDALKVSVDAGSLSGRIPMGQEIAIQCNGLALGRYADMVQLGVESFNDEKMRVEPGRIPYPYFAERMQLIGNPDVNKIVVDTMTIPELLASDSTVYSKLICIKDVHFTGLGDEGESLREQEKIFAPSTFNGTYNVGYPQSRQIADANGNVAYISTSEYARFAETALPAEDVWGDVVAIVGWYDDKADDDSNGEFQLTIRSLDDLHGFFDGTGGDTPTPNPDTPAEDAEGDGSKENPYNVVAAVQNQGATDVWVKAYIVGQINGDWDVNMQYDAPFTGDTNEDGSIKTYGTNLLISDNAAANTTAEVMPVQLPTGAVRLALNLVENPEMDGKEVLMYGDLISYFSQPGLKNVSCAIVDGVVYGIEPVDVENAILDITFTSGLGDFVTYDVLGEQSWSSDATYGAKMSGYANSRSNANEDWLISPALDLSGKSNVKILFEHAINKGDLANLTTNHTLWVSDNYNEENPNDATWTQVAITTYPDGASWTYVSSDEIVLPAEYMKSNVRFAFKYLCSDNESATWEVRNLKVYQ